jgi:hypothetical protein
MADQKEREIPLLLRFRDTIEGSSKVNTDSGRDQLAKRLNRLLRKDELNRQENLNRLIAEITSLVNGKLSFLDKLTILTEVTEENLLKVSIHLEILKLPPPSDKLAAQYPSQK